MSEKGKSVISDSDQIKKSKEDKPYLFKKGDPRINRAGRPKGIRTAAAILIEHVTEGHIEKALDNINMALASGDSKISQWIIERVAPHRKVAKLTLDLPEVKKSEDIFNAINSINKYVASGEITADEGYELLRNYEIVRRIDENVRLESKLENIESILNNK